MFSSFSTPNHPDVLIHITLSLNIKVVATTAPPIALVLGFVLVFSGTTSGNSSMVQAGWIFVAVGVLLQLAYLATRYVLSAWIAAQNRARSRQAIGG